MVEGVVSMWCLSNVLPIRVKCLSFFGLLIDEQVREYQKLYTSFFDQMEYHTSIHQDCRSGVPSTLCPERDRCDLPLRGSVFQGGNQRATKLE